MGSPKVICGMILLVLNLSPSQSLAAESNRRDASFRDCRDCPEMVVVPPGRFEMGSSPDELASEGKFLYEPEVEWEQPKHWVTIDYSFAIGKYEVTRGEYAAFVQETNRAHEGCKVYVAEKGTWEPGPGKTWNNVGFDQTNDHPVVCVKWADAVAYAEWLSSKTGHIYRLPSEAEWEYAARGGTTTSRYWGKDQNLTCAYANVSDVTRKKSVTPKMNVEQTFLNCDDGFVWTSPVGSFLPNKFGLYDVLGNVWEFTADCFYPNYQGAPQDGSAWTGGECIYRPFRGGSFSALSYNFRATQRAAGADKHYVDDPSQYRSHYLGFRVARDLSR